MAAMSTVLEVFADNGNSRTYLRSGHTALKPSIVIQKRKMPTGAAVVAEDTVNVIDATTDASGAAVPQRVSFMVTIRRPINGNADDVTAALTTFRDIVAGDQFGTVVTKQSWLKA